MLQHAKTRLFSDGLTRNQWLTSIIALTVLFCKKIWPGNLKQDGGGFFTRKIPITCYFNNMLQTKKLSYTIYILILNKWLNKVWSKIPTEEDTNSMNLGCQWTSRTHFKWSLYSTTFSPVKALYTEIKFFSEIFQWIQYWV